MGRKLKGKAGGRVPVVPDVDDAPEDVPIHDPFAGDAEVAGADEAGEADGVGEHAEVAAPRAVEYMKEAAASADLPWRPVDASSFGGVMFEETGFFGLEEVPAGSYELIKKPGGGFIIKTKAKATPAAASAGAASAGAASKAPAPAATPAAASTASVSGVKRKREEASGAAASTTKADASAHAAPESEDDGDAASDNDDDADAAAALALPAGKRSGDRGGRDGASTARSGVLKSNVARHVPALPSSRDALPVEEVAAEWGVLDLHPALVTAIAKLGFPKPTRIQAAALPAAIRSYKDVVGAAATGSGKTLAYALPIIHRLLERKARYGMLAGGASGDATADGGASAPPLSCVKYWKHLPALILAPTRELAVQVCDHIAALVAAGGLGACIRVAPIVGGLASAKQLRLLRKRPDIIVATPGRFWELVSSGEGSAGGADGYLRALHRLQFLVLDEADRLCEKGHFAALGSILAALKPPADDDEEEKEGAESSDEEGGKVAVEEEAAADGEADDSDDEESEDQGEDDEDTVGKGKAAKRGKKAAAEKQRKKVSFVDPEAERIIAEIEAKQKAAAAAAAAAFGDAGAATSATAKPAKAAAAATVPLVSVPRHTRRQTFLFSATLGSLTTAQSIRDAAKALVAAQAAEASAAAKAAAKGSGADGSGSAAAPRMGKNAMRRAMADAAKLTPVEALMARVGLLGKPAVITVDSLAAADAEEAEVAAAAAAAESDDDDAGSVGGDAGSVVSAGRKSTATRSVRDDAASVVSGRTGISTAAGGVAGAAVSLPAGLRLARVSCVDREKDTALYYILLRYTGRTLIFVNAISTLRRVAALLTTLKLPVHTLHAGMQQRQRLAHLERFRSDPYAIMIATDVAARGLDIPRVDYVLHYALPHSAESFVHRCGRTARAEASGLAAALVSPADQKQYVKLMGLLGLDKGLPEFPVDTAYARRIVARISVARKIANATAEAHRKSSAQHWLISQAKATGMQIDEFTADELGLDADELTALAAEAGLDGGDSDKEDDEEADETAGIADAAPAAKRRRTDDGASKKAAGKGKRGGKAAVGDSDDEGGKRDADAVAERHFQAKQHQRQIAAWRRELDELLSQSLLPAGASRKYVTSNPLLAEGAHPMQAAVRIVADDDDDGDATMAAAASSSSGSAASKVAKTSGSALVAPKVLLPMQTSVGGRRGIIVSADRSDAITALERKGKHVHMPGSAPGSTGRKAHAAGAGFAKKSFTGGAGKAAAALMGRR